MLHKIRMVIADLDYEYIIPIQNQIAKAYGNLVDLEIITDKEYYTNLFTKPQNIDILLVSDSLYNDSIHKHEIKNLFLLSDNNTNIPNVTTIEKYSSVKEIINIVFGKSQKFVYENRNENNRTTNVIVIYSPIGGVGKTSIALSLAATLNKNYKSVLYLEASRLNTFQGYLSDKSPINNNEVYFDLESGNDNKYNVLKKSIKHYSFDYIPSFKASLLSLNLSFSIFVDFVKESKERNEYDFVIVDTDCAFDEEKAALMGLADKVIIVTKQDEYSAYALERLVSNLTNIKSEKYMIICNDYLIDNDNALQDNHNIQINEYIEHVNEKHEDNYFLLETNDAIKRLAFLLI